LEKRRNTMFDATKAFSGFAVNDLEKAKQFYGDTLGLDMAELDEQMGLAELRLGQDRNVLVYLKPDSSPANFTILNLPVDDIDDAVDELTRRGVSFERYEGFDQDEKGIFRGGGPLIAWLTDPSGNILSVMQES
jgi:predicted enzyme related to lactoylglutathione lyase